MKICPSCQQSYADDSPDYCTNDGTPLVRSAADYGAGAPGYKWQTPTDQYPQPPSDLQPPPPGWGTNPPGPQAPYGYGMPYAPASGGGGLSTAALLTGIGAVFTLIMGYGLIFIGASSFNLGLIQFGALLIILSVITGLTALILGIVTLSMAGRNPGISKPKGVIGICLGAIPLLLMLIGLIMRSAR